MRTHDRLPKEACGSFRGRRLVRGECGNFSFAGRGVELSCEQANRPEERDSPGWWVLAEGGSGAARLEMPGRGPCPPAGTSSCVTEEFLSPRLLRQLVERPRPEQARPPGAFSLPEDSPRKRCFSLLTVSPNNAGNSPSPLRLVTESSCVEAVAPRDNILPKKCRRRRHTEDRSPVLQTHRDLSCGGGACSPRAQRAPSCCQETTRESPRAPHVEFPLRSARP